MWLIEAGFVPSHLTSLSRLKAVAAAQAAAGAGAVVMPEPQKPAIPPDLADAFRDAVWAFCDWGFGGSEPNVFIGDKPFQISGVCDLVDSFTDDLPYNVSRKLSSEIDDTQRPLKEALRIRATYNTAASCLRALIQAKNAKHQWWASV